MVITAILKLCSVKELWVQDAAEQYSGCTATYSSNYNNGDHSKPTAYIYAVTTPLLHLTMYATIVLQVSDQPMPYSCSVCNTQSVTRVEYKVGTMTVLLVVLLCLLLWPIGLCPLALIPCCVNGTKDAHHSCPNCNNYIGAKKRM